jgi:hypothetical protein
MAVGTGSTAQKRARFLLEAGIEFQWPPAFAVAAHLPAIMPGSTEGVR